MWGKVVLDRGQLSERVDKWHRVSVIYRGAGRWRCMAVLGGVLLCCRTPTSPVVQALHERPQGFLVEDGALCVTLA